MGTIFVYLMHQGGRLHDTARELLGAGLTLDPAAQVVALVAGDGPALDSACQEAAGLFPQVWKIAHPDLTQINAELLRPLLARLIPAGALTLLAHEHFGMDLAPGLAVKLDAAYLADAVALEGTRDGRLVAVRDILSGMVRTRVAVDLAGGLVATLRPGAFKAVEPAGSYGLVIDKSEDALAGGLPDLRRRYLQTVAAEAGDVDITKAEVLVSVGRGIEDEENLEIAFNLAKALGAEVSCSRPIVDAKWLEKARQVGTSGKTVRPKIYLACGISGSSQHLGGLQGASFVIAINKNAKAPIFQRADVGVVTDIIKFLPQLTEAVKGAR